MKLYLIIPVVALAALAAEPVMARGGHGHGGRGGGHSMVRSGGSSVAVSSGAGIGGSSGVRIATPAGARRSHSHHGHRGHRAHRHHHHNHHHHRRGHRHNHHHWRGQANTYPRNFANYGYSANYNTPYYQGGFRQQTSPYGFPSVFQNNPYAYRAYGGYGNYGTYANYGRDNRVLSYGTRNGFYPYTGYYAPYYQGQPQQGYRAFGVYGPNGPYTVPGSGVSTASVQSRLYQSGYYRGPVDGFAGPLTRTAIRNYQYQWGLPVTGRIDGHLIQSLRNSFYYY